MRRLQILRGQLQYKPELKDGEFFLDKTNHSLLIGDASVADGQFELAKQSAITNLQQQVDTKITAAQAPVQSVNTKTGAVVLTAADVGALPDTTTIPTKTSELTNDSGYITQTDGDGRYLKLSGGTLTGDVFISGGKSLKMGTGSSDPEGSLYVDSTGSFVVNFENKAVKIYGNSMSVSGNLLLNAGTPTSSNQAAPKSYVDQYAPHATLVTLTVAGWNSTAKTQTVTVSGILADESKQLIIPMPAAASMTAYNDAGIQCTGQAANSLTFTADTVPTAAISVYVTYQAVIS